MKLPSFCQIATTLTVAVGVVAGVAVGAAEVKVATDPVYKSMADGGFNQKLDEAVLGVTGLTCVGIPIIPLALNRRRRTLGPGGIN